MVQICTHIIFNEENNVFTNVNTTFFTIHVLLHIALRNFFRNFRIPAHGTSFWKISFVLKNILFIFKLAKCT